jgi:hypothetical protein
MMKLSHIGILLFGLIGMGAAMPAFASSLCTSVSDNLIGNCNFGTGDFTDWTVTDAAAGSFVNVSTIDPNTGETYAARFGASSLENDYIDQSFATISGDTYDVSFYVDASKVGSESKGEFVANWDGTNILTITGLTGTGYELYSFTETATSNSSDLQFGGNDQLNSYHLDDVVVTQAGTSAVPEPSSISFAVAGLFGILLVGRRYMEKRSNS